tara:strand:- start:178 stop:468 length:291 start_codon:yes stop_codon:yes gene_type:complete
MRTKVVNGERIELTAAENAVRDAEEKDWTDGGFDRAMVQLRQQRNQLLSESDFYALSDVTMSVEMQTYRQKLRDLPAGLTTVEDVEAAVWPTKPGQ